MSPNLIPTAESITSSVIFHYIGETIWLVWDISKTIDQKYTTEQLWKALENIQENICGWFLSCVAVNFTPVTLLYEEQIMSVFPLEIFSSIASKIFYQYCWLDQIR